SRCQASLRPPCFAGRVRVLSTPCGGPVRLLRELGVVPSLTAQTESGLRRGSAARTSHQFFCLAGKLLGPQLHLLLAFAFLPFAVGRVPLRFDVGRRRDRACRAVALVRRFALDRRRRVRETAEFTRIVDLHGVAVFVFFAQFLSGEEVG